jgi:hypothetical protein
VQGYDQVLEEFLMERKERGKWGTLFLGMAQSNMTQRAWRFGNSRPSKFELGPKSKMTSVAKGRVQQTLAHFQIQISKEVQCLVDMAMVTVIGIGMDAAHFFGRTNSSMAKRIKDLALGIYTMVHKRVVNNVQSVRHFAINNGF